MIKKLTIRSLKIFGITLGSILVFLLIFSFVINFFFKDQLIKYLVDQLNKQINAKIDVAQTDFSFWKSFPNASVEFENVVIHPSNHWIKYNGQHTDTLLASDKVIFEFNIIKLFNKNYVLNKIRVQDGNIYLNVDRMGHLNYDIFKKSDEGGTKLSLKAILIRRCNINYSNVKADVNILTFSNKTNIGGIIQDKILDFRISTDLLVNQLLVHNINYVNQREFSATCHLYINNNAYSFNNVKFNIEQLNFLFNGKYLTGSSFDQMHFKITGDRLNLNQLMDFLPANYRQSFENYSAKGKIDLDISIDGKVGSYYSPLVNISCNTSNSSITEHKSNIKLENLSFNGSFTNGVNRDKQTSVILVNKFSSKIRNGEISLQGKLTNLLQPKVEINGITKFELNDIKNFIKLDTFEVLKGNIDGTFSMQGFINSKDKIKFSDLHIESLSGNFSVHNTDVKLKDGDYALHNINGLISLSNDISFNDVTLKFNESDVRLTGKLINGLPYFLNQTTDATVEAELFSPSIDLSSYFTRKGQKSRTVYSRQMLFPQHLNLDIKLNINEFVLNKFKARWVKGYLQYKPTMFVLKSLSFETLEGSLRGNGVIVQDINQHFTMKGQVDVSKINIQQAFYTFNNFGQKIVRDNHLRGRLSGKISFTSEWNSNLAFIPDKLIVDASMSISNGELVNFEPMNGLSRFISLDELRNIKFSTLKNTIYIKDKQIIIPEMDINSSAFNISGSGVHNFDNHYQYKVKVLLSEVLYGKAKKAKKENEDYGRVEDDGLGRTSIYLTVDGFGKDYKISYDSRKTLDIVKESLVKQKRELKEIFHDEFGWFKNDSTIKTSKKNQPGAVRVQFDDDIEPVQQNQPVDPKKKKQESADKVEVEWE